MNAERKGSGQRPAPRARVIGWREYCQLVLSRRRLSRLESSGGSRLGVIDHETGERIVVDDSTVPGGRAS